MVLAGLCLSLVGCGCLRETGPAIAPDEFETLTIYPSGLLRGPIPEASQLATMTHVQLGAKRVRRLFAHCRHRWRWVLWKGAYLGIARTTDGRDVRLFISVYGGFFAIEAQDGFWTIGEAEKTEWMRLLRLASMRVFQKDVFEPLETQPQAALRVAKVGDKYGYINQAGSMVIEARFDDAMPFSEGLAAVRVGDPDEGEWGYIDTAGRFVIEPRFAGASFFSEGLAAVTVDDFFKGKQGYINRQGEMVIQPQFDAAWPFRNGVGRVWLGEAEGTLNVLDSRFVNREGEFVKAR